MTSTQRNAESTVFVEIVSSPKSSCRDGTLDTLFSKLNIGTGTPIGRLSGLSGDLLDSTSVVEEPFFEDSTGTILAFS